MTDYSEFDKIGCRDCDSPDCRGCNIYILAKALGQGKLNWAKTRNNTIDPGLLGVGSSTGMTVNLSADDCENAATLMELYIFQYIHDLQEDGEIDNIEFLRSLIKCVDEMNRLAKERSV